MEPRMRKLIAAGATALMLLMASPAGAAPATQHRPGAVERTCYKLVVHMDDGTTQIIRVCLRV